MNLNLFFFASGANKKIWDAKQIKKKWKVNLKALAGSIEDKSGNVSSNNNWKIGKINPNKQIKSRKRVREIAEVYTANTQVKSMLDLAFDTSNKIESRFFEPGCGNGNFLDFDALNPLKFVHHDCVWY